MSERGMKKWAPYKSLNEQEDYLKRLHQQQEKTSRPKMSSDVADAINEILSNYQGEELIISYWRNDKINTVSTILTKIDPANKKIILPNRRTILFSEFINIERA